MPWVFPMVLGLSSVEAYPGGAHPGGVPGGMPGGMPGGEVIRLTEEENAAVQSLQNSLALEVSIAM